MLFQLRSGQTRYRTAWSGGWHLPDSGPEIRGFECLHDQHVRLGHGSVADIHVTDRAIDFLQQNQDTPFFLGVSLCNPHDICRWLTSRPAAPQDATGLPPLPANFERDPEEPEFIQQCRRSAYCQGGTHTADWTEPQWRNYLTAYYRLVEEVDVQVGRLLETLRSTGQEDDTLVLFTSDHGEGMAAHRWVCKLTLYEEPVRVPFVVRWPEVIPAGVVDRESLVSGLDVVPTLCSWAGVECPDVTGLSLRPALENRQAVDRSFLVTELNADLEDLQFQGRMLRTRSHKYVVFSQGRNPELLFDMEKDPGETCNLAGAAEAGPEHDRHRALLREWCARTGDPFTAP